MADEEIVAKDSIAYKNAERETEKVKNLVDQLGRDKSTTFPDPDFVDANDGELEPKTRAQEIHDSNEAGDAEDEAKNPEPNPNPDGKAPDALDEISKASEVKDEDEPKDPDPAAAPAPASNGGPEGTGPIPADSSGK